MRFLTTMLLLAAATYSSAARAADSGSPSFTFLSLAEAEQIAVTTESLQTRAWIWSDDYVYMPGNQLTVKWTVKSGADLLPITMVAYLQNNQTGAKTYLPDLGSEATDVFGNSKEDGFLISAIPNVDKGVLIGAGGMFPPITLPNELGMHTVVVEFRDWTGNTVLKRLYQKISVVDEVVIVSEAIESDATWVNTKSYTMAGTIIVRSSTLTIEPGTIIKGLAGSDPGSALIIRRDSMLMAEGTRSRPIIFTSNLPVGQRQPGDMAGVSLAGRAPTNQPGGEGTLEGLPPGEDSTYGGTDPTHNCGTLRYLRVEFAGAELTADNELNAITFASCGSDTVAEHLQAHYAFDDAFEWFGGSNNASYLVATGGRDDGLDVQLGYTGKVQFFALMNYDEIPSDHGIESDNSEGDNSAEPYTEPTVYNATFVGNGEICRLSCDGWRARRGLKGSWNNMVFTNFADDTIDFRDDITLANLANGELTSNGVLAWNNLAGTGGANTIDGQFPSMESNAFAKGTLGTGQNIEVGAPMFLSTEYSDWDLRPAQGSPLSSAQWQLPPSDGFFDQAARFIGAFGEKDWTEEWTNKKKEGDLN